MKGLHPSCQSSRIFLREHSGRDVRPSTFRVPRGRALCVLLLQLSRCSSWPGAVPALWPRQALRPRQHSGCAGSSLSPPTLSWDKGVVLRALRMVSSSLSLVCGSIPFAFRRRGQATGRRGLPPCPWSSKLIESQPTAFSGRTPARGCQVLRSSSLWRHATTPDGP